MKSSGILFFLFSIVLGTQANMAYLGPADAHVSGQQLMQHVRIQHEVLTADMRKLPGGTISVFADYRVLCDGPKGKIRFLFVASSAEPVNPEIILDGKIIKSDPLVSDFRPELYENPTPAQRDSLSQIIGYDLKHGQYHYQNLLDQLFVFEVEMEPGIHHLKVGYECSPTGYEEGDLRYTTFPYFLGNTQTRNLYDSIFVKIMLPEGVEYETNFDVKNEHGTLVSGNIAGFQKSHIAVSIFKNVEKDILYGSNVFMGIQYAIWAIFVCTTIWYLHWRKRRNKKLIVSLLWVIPVAILIPLLFVMGQEYYYQFYTEKYGIFLRGSFGKGYYLFLVFPFLMVVSGICWLALALVYHYLVCGKKWDPMRIFRKV